MLGFVGFDRKSPYLPSITRGARRYVDRDGYWIRLSGGLIATGAGNRQLGAGVIGPFVGIGSLDKFDFLPVFVFSSKAADVRGLLIDRRLLIYGRTRLLVTGGLGALVSVFIMALVALVVGPLRWFSEVEFTGGILPGLPAYDFGCRDSRGQLLDVGVSLPLFGGWSVSVAGPRTRGTGCRVGPLGSRPVVGPRATGLLLLRSDIPAAIGSTDGSSTPVRGDPIAVIGIGRVGRRRVIGLSIGWPRRRPTAL